MDDLYITEEFTFVREYRKGKEMVQDRIDCHIEGLRRRPNQDGGLSDAEED